MQDKDEKTHDGEEVPAAQGRREVQHGSDSAAAEDRGQGNLRGGHRETHTQKATERERDRERARAKSNGVPMCAELRFSCATLRFVTYSMQIQ
eukprot:9170107-Pyramimonas_sp.AAC.1